MTSKIAAKILDSFCSDRVIRLLEDLIRIPSHKQVEWQEDRLVLFLADYFTKNGIDEVEVDYICEDRPNLIARLSGGGGGKSLMLNGHTDTIPPYNMVIPPYEPQIKNGFIYGLGSVDMKGSLAAMVLAMILVKESGLLLKGDLIFAGVIDQEQCSKGTVRLVKETFSTDYAVVGEPTDLKICRAHKGMEWMKIIVKGHSTHGSTPEKGDNAIYQACRIAREIEALNKKLEERKDSLVSHPTINVGVISGGDDPNVVPNLAILEIDRRYTPSETLASIYQEVDEILARLKTRHPGFQIEVISMDDRVCSLKNTPLAMADDGELIHSLKRALREYRGEAEVTYFRGWSDAALLSKWLGIESIVFGCGLPEKCHAGDEALRVEDLITAVKVYLYCILHICQVEPA